MPTSGARVVNCSPAVPDISHHSMGWNDKNGTRDHSGHDWQHFSRIFTGLPSDGPGTCGNRLAVGNIHGSVLQVFRA